MKHRHTTHKRPAIIGIAFLAGSALLPLHAQEAAEGQAAPPPAAPPAQSEEMQELQTEWASIEAKLKPAEQHAAAQPEVVKEREKFNETVEEAMLEKDPELKDALEENKKLVEKLSTSPELAKPQQERDPEFVAEMQKYQALEQQLAGTRNEVMATEPEVKKQVDILQKTMIEEMTKVEPEAPQLLARREALVERFQALQR